MTDESHSHSETFTTKRTIERRSIYDNDNNLENKSRRFRWSSCFSFITKFKRQKSQKVRLSSQSFEHFDQKNYVSDNLFQVLQVKTSSVNSLPLKQQQQHTVSLSPPPRHSKAKRDSHIISHTKTYQIDQENDLNCGGGRRPLVDPTLTPRVKPRSTKTKKQPSLLRLSLDAELLQQSSPDGIFSLQDNESVSTCKTGHSSLSFTPTSTTQLQPFRTGTLGVCMKNSKSDYSPPLPPLPRVNIPLDNNSSTNTSDSNISQLADSPVSISTVEAATTIDDEEKLTLKERRHRRSPLSMPDTDQLILALKNLLVVEQQQAIQAIEQQKEPSTPTPSIATRRQSQTYYDNSSDEDDLLWRQQLLEQSIAFSFQNKSRQEAMMTLEGKKSRRAVSLQPIVNVHDLDDHFDNDSNDGTKRTPDVVRDKAEYDAIVSRTTMHRRQLSYDERKNSHRTSLRARSPSDSSTNDRKCLQAEQHPLDIIAENEIATTPISANKILFPTHGIHLSVTPETPPHHQQSAPSLISAPSTPNSIDSSVLDHDDYMNHDIHHHLTLV